MWRDGGPCSSVSGVPAGPDTETDSGPEENTETDEEETMADWQSSARHFIENETQFHLGMLPTEQSHPKTKGLAETLQRDVAAGVRLLQSVDEEVAAVAEHVFAGDAFGRLVQALSNAVRAGGRVCFSGCGATGRLSILLESCWRHFWLGLGHRHPAAAPRCQEMADRAWSIMTGGDYALIRSVENFEDFVAFGRQQLVESGIGAGDVLVGISEGGETSSVIGTVREAQERGAQAFFVFNNPADVLAAHIERSREVIECPSIVILDLASGPMAVAGSTRMQATTAELLVVGAAVELAASTLARDILPDDAREALLDRIPAPSGYASRFRELLAELARPDAVEALADWVCFERDLYGRGGVVTYFAGECLIDIFTDTTERAPTFMLPPFRKCDDSVSPLPWAFVKDPTLRTPDAWRRALARDPRCLGWDSALYAQLGAPESIRRDPPRIGAEEIRKFHIGNEDDPARYSLRENAAVLVLVGDETGPGGSQPELASAFVQASEPFAQRLSACIGGRGTGVEGADALCRVACSLPPTPVRLWDRLAAKLVLNTVSTATMGCMGRMVSNWMAHVDTSNKKLIDRGSRLVAELADVDYETACYALHETIDDLARSVQPGQARPSPVAATIERLRRRRGADGTGA